ncbi:HNH endonuclease signature motif containing protein [Xanthomonas sp. NCPPB 3443]|uniref:HNH endonuclease signature motif containing protein n=1 Tax=Xanthomonas sp. NCPPB 3443 TaxID=3243407 RepID=UPI003558FDD5
MPVTETGCWLWTGATDTLGYGLITVARQKSGAAHRAAYAELVGPIPRGMAVCHRCDTPSCCNPEHLFLGSQAENMRDASAKARISACRLTHQQALEVRMSKEATSAIARRLGVALHVIYKCRRGVTYPATSILKNRVTQ